MAMSQYDLGLKRKIGAARTIVALKKKQVAGYLRRYPVYRPDFQHTVYAADNEELGSTFLFDAKITHQVSWSSPISKPALVEFEHGTALVGHLDRKTDYRAFIGELPSRLKRFWDWFVPGRHRLVAPTVIAAETAKRLFSAHGYQIPENALDVLYWTHRKLRQQMEEVILPIKVFHLGGAYPYSKGTRDVLDLAKRFPQVQFDIWVKADHPCVAGLNPPNVNIWPRGDFALYNRLLSQSHVVLLPTYGDAWGIVLEALAWAIPIITYDTFDKSETVINGQTGYLCHISKELSFYEGMEGQGFRNWTEYNEYLGSYDNSAQVQTLSLALENYCKNPQLLLEHSRQTSAFFDERFKPGKRVPRIRQIYGEILGSLSGLHKAV